MAYEGINYNHLFLRTLTGTLDFKGRSTPTEFIVYAIVAPVALMFVLVPVTLLWQALGPPVRIEIPDALAYLSWLYWLPVIALIVRRLHDQGQSAWLALLFVPLAVLTYIQRAYPIDAQPLYGDAPVLTGTVHFVLVIGFWVLLLWPGVKEANRYGPDPRQV